MGAGGLRCQGAGRAEFAVFALVLGTHPFLFSPRALYPVVFNAATLEASEVISKLAQ